MKEQLLGTTLPVLSITLEAGESVVAEAGEFSWMTDSIQMSGSSLLLSSYTALDTAGTIAFAAKLPGSILGIGIGPQREYLVHRHGFLAGTPGIQLAAGFQQSFSAGIYAGEGFALQQVGGEGRAWIHLTGEVITYDLAAGESLRVHPGHVGMFAASVSFQVVRVPGIANRYFGGDSHYFAVLSGPGSVWLQSMPMAVLAASLAPFLTHGLPEVTGISTAALGGGPRVVEELKSFTK